LPQQENDQKIAAASLGDVSRKPSSCANGIAETMQSVSAVME